jgi:hypothetical protein
MEPFHRGIRQYREAFNVLAGTHQALGLLWGTVRILLPLCNLDQDGTYHFCKDGEGAGICENALTNTCRHSDMQQARTNSSTRFVLPTTMFLRNVLLWLKAATYHVSSGSKTYSLHGRLSQLRKCKPNIRRRLFPILLVRDTSTIPHQDQVELASRGASHS